MDVSNNSALLGEIKQFHSFNGAIQIPRGWMQCNGNVINETNYDAIHGSGAFVADGIADLVLNGKYTPDLIDKYVVGASSTTQDGSSTISSVGNTDHEVNLSHSHTVNSHNHQWYDFTESGGSNDDMESYNSSGGKVSLESVNTQSYSRTKGIPVGTSSDNVFDVDLHTSNSSPGTSSSGSTTQSVQPESIQVMFIIRVGI